MIVPTIGRQVLVHIRGQRQRCPASICMVHSDTIINVAGFMNNGSPFKLINVRLAQDDDICHPGMAEWMPYQKAQAEKHQVPEVPEKSYFNKKVTDMFKSKDKSVDMSNVGDDHG